jgi:hypothetical protein
MQSVLHLAPINTEQFNTNMRNLGYEEVAAIEKEMGELTLFAASHEPQPSSTGGVVINGSLYGSLQTGNASEAHVVLNLDSTSAIMLRDAVQALREQLRTSQPTDLPTIADAVFAELEVEASQSHPNPKRIMALLSASTAMIATLANVPGAWETVRRVASAIGIVPP